MTRDDAYRRKLDTIAESLHRIPDDPTDLTGLETEGVLHLVQVSIDAAMDLAAMTVKDHGRTVQDDYHNLQTLVDLDVLDASTSEELRTLNGLRNAIVHKYNSFEEREVLENVDTIQNTLLDYAKTVEATL